MSDKTFLWARRLAPRVRWMSFDAGHALVVILALVRDFYRFTSVLGNRIEIRRV
jgi:hypothetical protein